MTCQADGPCWQARKQRNGHCPKPEITEHLIRRHFGKCYAHVAAENPET